MISFLFYPLILYGSLFLLYPLYIVGIFYIFFTFLYIFIQSYCDYLNRLYDNSVFFTYLSHIIYQCYLWDVFLHVHHFLCLSIPLYFGLAYRYCPSAHSCYQVLTSRIFLLPLRYSFLILFHFSVIYSSPPTYLEDCILYARIDVCCFHV